MATVIADARAIVAQAKSDVSQHVFAIERHLPVVRTLPPLPTKADVEQAIRELTTVEQRARILASTVRQAVVELADLNG